MTPPVREVHDYRPRADAGCRRPSEVSCASSASALSPRDHLFSVFLWSPGSERATAAGEPSRHAHTAGRRTQKPGRGRERPWERHAVRRRAALREGTGQWLRKTITEALEKDRAKLLDRNSSPNPSTKSPKKALATCDFCCDNGGCSVSLRSSCECRWRIRQCRGKGRMQSSRLRQQPTLMQTYDSCGGIEAKLSKCYH